MNRIQVGDSAPGLCRAGPTTGTISAWRTIGATASWCSTSTPRTARRSAPRRPAVFGDAYEEFARAGAVVIGVSGDSAQQHRAFAGRKRLPFLLVSDSEGSLRRLYRVPRTLGIVPGRLTFVIDKAGIVRHVSRAMFSAERHVAEALKVVRELIREGPEGRCP